MIIPKFTNIVPALAVDTEIKHQNLPFLFCEFSVFPKNSFYAIVFVARNKTMILK